MTRTLRRSLHWIGNGLALIGVIFVALRLRIYWGDLEFSRITLSIWLSIGVLTVLYGLANLLLVSAWRCLLHWGGVPVPRFWSIKVYGISQLAKYLPGNIFHLAGRQALGMAAGILPGVLARSMLWELGLIAFAGSLFSWLILPLLWPDLSVGLCMFLLLGSIILATCMLKKFAAQQAALAFVRQMIFLAISGGIFVAILAVISVGREFGLNDQLTIGGAYIAAWLVGLLMPGAPAGVGVREVILLFLLKGEMVEAELLMAVLLGRLITVAGDMLFFAAAHFIPAKTKSLHKDDV